VHAAETVAGLQAYRAVHGRFPAELEALVPLFLPRVPIDPWDGKPIKYRLTEEGETIQVHYFNRKPDTAPANGFILYSIGGDRLDQGGRVHCREIWALHPKAPNGQEIHADWVIWPTLR
jgi:hypothetical protein